MHRLSTQIQSFDKVKRTLLVAATLPNIDCGYEALTRTGIQKVSFAILATKLYVTYIVLI